MTEFCDPIIKYLKKQDEERKRLHKWRHYADHAKKRRTRKKYQKKIRDYYAATPHAKADIQVRASVQHIHPKCGHFPLGNWPYGVGAGLFQRPATIMRGGIRP